MLYVLMRYDNDIMRFSDKKEFTSTLADLKAVDENSKNGQLLDDHAVWHTNC